jgi:hypothetical protein
MFSGVQFMLEMLLRSHNREDKQPGQDSQDGTTEKGPPEQNSYKRKAKAGLAGQDGQERIARKRPLEWTARTEIARTGRRGKENHDRTIRTGQNRIGHYGQDNQDIKL